MGAPFARQGAEVLVPGKRYSVFSIRTTKKHETIWIRAGFAYVKPDDSMNITLDVLPMDGQLHVRETGEKRNNTNNTPARSEKAAEPVPTLAAQQAMGGH